VSKHVAVLEADIDYQRLNRLWGFIKILDVSYLQNTSNQREFCEDLLGDTLE